jgi:hypothetical protein
MSEAKAAKRRWTYDEVCQLKMLATGARDAEQIADILQRSPASITMKAFWLGLSLASRTGGLVGGET